MNNAEEIHSYSRNAVFLEMFFNDKLLATASGLIAADEHGRAFLCTALHNFTGREPNGKCKFQAALPNFVKITGVHFRATMALYSRGNDPNSDDRIYWRHPGGPLFDVCVLPIVARIDQASVLDRSFLTPARYSASVRLHVSQMCYIIGYPEGLYVKVADGSVLPIWKTGHIASEPSVAIDGQAKILIDAATCAGMSGSPVFATTSPGHRLVGIYAGRLSTMSDVGYVFGPECLMDIFKAGPILGPMPYAR